MNSPDYRRQLAAMKKAARIRRVSTIRKTVAVIGVSLAIAFSTIVVQRQTDSTALAASAAVVTATADPSVTESMTSNTQSTGGFTSESQATTAAQPEPLTTSQS